MNTGQTAPTTSLPHGKDVIFELKNVDHGKGVSFLESVSKEAFITLLDTMLC
jgi:hypothetical protein